MKMIRFLLTGVLFGIIMTKSEAVSWFRIQEMFRFQSFHMFGIIGTAVLLGAILIYFLKNKQKRNLFGDPIKIAPKANTYKAGILGGTLFGLGWAMTGACPGPLYTLFGHGYLIILVIVGSALLGTLTYGAVKNKLPH
jgi:uncharacterized protein